MKDLFENSRKRKSINERFSFKRYSAIASCFIVTIFLISILAKGNNVNSKYNLNGNNAKLINDSSKSDEYLQASKSLNKKKKSNNLKNDDSKEISQKEISFTFPVSGAIVTKFSPNTLIYNEVLELFATSNGITLKTNQIDLNSTCEGTIKSIEAGSGTKSKIIITTSDNHEVTLSGFFSNFTKHEGDRVLKGAKIADIVITNDEAYVEVEVKNKDGYIDPELLFK